MTNGVLDKIHSTSGTRRAGIRRNKKSTNPDKKPTVLCVADSFKEIQEENDKALKILAKQS